MWGGIPGGIWSSAREDGEGIANLSGGFLLMFEALFIHLWSVHAVGQCENALVLTTRQLFEQDNGGPLRQVVPPLCRLFLSITRDGGMCRRAALGYKITRTHPCRVGAIYTVVARCNHFEEFHDCILHDLEGSFALNFDSTLGVLGLALLVALKILRGAKLRFHTRSATWRWTG